jgi:hypothetical protein
MQDPRLKALALQAVRTRAQYLDALAELAGQTCPLGMPLDRKARLEDAIHQVAVDEVTSIPELEYLVTLAQGLQH